MADSFWLSDAQMARIEPFIPLSLGVARVDDRRVFNGIIHVIRTGRASPASTLRPWLRCEKAAR